MDSIIFGKWFYLTYNLGNVFSFLWFFVHQFSEYIWYATVLLLGMTMALAISASFAHHYMYRVDCAEVTAKAGISTANSNDFEAGNSSTQSTPKWLTDSKYTKPLLSMIVVNAIAFYATWCVVASHLSVGIVICYKLGMAQDSTSILMLCILTAVILFYWFLDFYYLRSYLQHTYSPYIVLIVAFTGILTNGGLDVDDRVTSPFVLALLLIAVLGTFAKVIMGICMRNQPVKVSNTIESVSV